MKLKRLFIFIGGLTIFSTIATGCSIENSQQQIEVHTTKNPDASETLELQPEADLFQWGDVIYIADVDWVQGLELSKGIEIGEIAKNTSNPKDFTNGTANKLPIGAKIYEPLEKNGPIYIVVVNGKEIRYLGLLEG